MADKKTSSGKKKKPSVKALPEIIVVIALVLIVTLYYFSVPPFSFDLGIGFKYSADKTPEDKDPEGGGNNPVVASDGNLVMTVINVGQGDSVLLELPDGKTMLIDGGDQGSFKVDDSETRFKVSDAILDVLASKNITDLDYLLLTHTDSDHCGSLGAVVKSDKVLVHTVYMPYVKSKYVGDPIATGTVDIPDSFKDVQVQSITTGVYETFVESVVAEGSEIRYSEKGTVISGEGYRMTFVTPNPSQYSSLKNAKDKNNVSPIILLEYSSVKVMLTGDAAKKGEEIFVENYQAMNLDVDVDVLKAGHHGSKESSNQFFLDVIKPEYVVISAGYKNSYNHPEKETLDRFSAIGAEVYCTIDCGTISLSADKDGFSFKCEKIKAQSYKIVDPFGFTASIRLPLGVRI